MKLSPAVWFGAVAAVVVIAAIVAGLVVVGPPGDARLHSLDGQRVSAMQQIASDIDAYTAARHALPQSLEQLAVQQSDLTPASIGDPASGALYEYRATGAASYELCASFGIRTEPDEAIRWRHGPGRACFQFTVSHPASPPA
jgi:hypothetical protein